MRNLVVIILSFLLTSWVSVSLSQSQKDFPITNANWRNEIYTEDWSGPNPPNYVLTNFENYYIGWIGQTDTTINSIQYSILSSPGTYKGAIRSSNNRVYYIPKDSISEFLLYDFNAQVGDTVFNVFVEDIWWNHGLYDLVVQNVDSVLIGSVYHKQIHFTDGGRWIEGIGSLRGLLKETWNNISQYQVYLGCMSKEDTSLYPTYSENVHCDVLIVGTENSNIKHPNLIRLYPNPASSSFQIKSTVVSQGQLKLFNLKGQLVKQFKFCNQCNFDVSDLPKGVYFIQLIANRKVYSSKLMKID